MSYKKQVLAMAMMFAAMEQPMGLPQKASVSRDVPPPKPIIPRGCKEYAFWHEGKQFTCIASNDKQAERKFEKWRAKRPQR